MRNLAVAAIVAGCSSPARPPVAPATPEASTTCYAGLSKGMGQSARTIARRTVDPAAKQIIEDVSHDEAGAHGAKSFHVVMTIAGDHFTMVETGGAFTGSGTLTGEPWEWTAWTSTSTIPNTGIEVASVDELTPTGMKATKEIRKDGKVLATTSEELKPFDCAEWDTVKASLALTAPDPAGCERACRNYATLKYWRGVDNELAGLAAVAREEARKQRVTELVDKLAAGLPACITACVAANNAVQTACWADAKTADALDACATE